jgi:hypothetical protein
VWDLEGKVMGMVDQFTHGGAKRRGILYITDLMT